ncbi:MAG: tRNA pseudouridine(38-40) synthase TruA [Methanobacteriota archaeon]
MRRFAVKVAYDGTRFQGSQRQPHGNTVEDALLSALCLVGAVDVPKAARFLMAGRTDKGVSARANVFAVATDMAPGALLPATGARLDGVWPWAYAEVPPRFHPRAAIRRRYRYFLPAHALDAGAFDRAIQLFAGEHDFAAFSRREEGRGTVRRIDRIGVRRRTGLLVVDVEGESFLWHQVRRIVAAAREVAAGDATEDEIVAALSDPAPSRTRFGIAPAEGLVLLDVAYDGLRFRSVAAARRRMREALLATERGARVQQELSKALRASNI